MTRTAKREMVRTWRQMTRTHNSKALETQSTSHWPRFTGYDALHEDPDPQQQRRFGNPPSVHDQKMSTERPLNVPSSWDLVQVKDSKRTLSEYC